MPLLKSPKLEFLLFKGDRTRLENFYNDVVSQLGKEIENCEPSAQLARDLEILNFWLGDNARSTVWHKLAIESSWDPANAAEVILSIAESSKSDDAFRKAAGVPSESDLEDALTWTESVAWTGSPKQIAWAKVIAQKHLNEIALAWKNNKEVPTEAKWWIEHRQQILGSFKSNQKPD